MQQLPPNLTPLIALVGLIACNPSPEVAPGVEPPSQAPSPEGTFSLRDYDFTSPSSSFHLPPELREISALTDMDDRTIACVQDEVGTVFFIDLPTGEVVKRQPFGPAGDYEGITRVNRSLWVLESGGLMIELVDRDNTLSVRRERRLDLDHDDIEGLGHDPTRNAILVAPKDKPNGDKAEKGVRRIFAVDAESGDPMEALALETSLDRIEADAKRAGIALPTKVTKGGREKVNLKLRFSSVAVHPYSNQLFVLSAVDAAVLAFDRDGELRGAHFFDPESMPKIEGMTFMANGDLVIASEGMDGPARIAVFRCETRAPR
tara:strand:- start:10321 stop:11274 length:954 start_codon:yes stop_codon:yes gene_type:complete